MLISDAIGLVNSYRPNLYTDADKVKWLSMLDGMVFREIIENHVNMNPKLITYNAAVDYVGTDVPVRQPVFDHTLDGAWFNIGGVAYCVDENEGGVLKFTESVSVTAWEPIVPIAKSGYNILPSEAYEQVELLIPEPYAEDVYINYLESRIDKENAEMAKYNADISLYNQAYQTYSDFFNRNNMPKRRVTHIKL